MRPAKRLKTSSLQAQQSSDANMANSTGEREERPRMYKKTRVVQQLKHKGEGGEGEDWGGGDGGVGGGEAAGGGNGKAVGRILASDSAGVALVMGPAL
jgi:hypothetical protein